MRKSKSKTTIQVAKAPAEDFDHWMSRHSLDPRFKEMVDNIGEHDADEIKAYADEVDRAQYRAEGDRHNRALHMDAHDVDGPTPCRACGAAVPAKNAKYIGPWRIHKKCSLEPADIAAHFGVTASADDAKLLSRFGYLPTLWPGQYPAVMVDETLRETPIPWSDGARSPWCWVEQYDLDHLHDGVDHLDVLRAKAKGQAIMCISGRCAWCGTSRSTSWRDCGHRWADGSTAPLCAVCADRWDLACTINGHMVPSHPEDAEQRRALTALVIGSKGSPWDVADVPTFLERQDDVHGDGHDAWEHISPEALQALRYDRWGVEGGKYAPGWASPEQVREAVRHVNRDRRERARRRAAEEAERQAGERTYEF